MKKQIFTILLCIVISGAFAQEKTGGVTTRYVFNEKTVVKDSSGKAYPYPVWHQLMISGNYVLKPTNPGASELEYVLVQLTPAQKADRLSRMPPPAASPYFTTGQHIKPFKIKDIYGNKLEAKDWAGKTIVLNFWFIGCPPCQAEIPELNKIAADYKDDPNVVFIGIALDEDFEIKDFIKNTPFNYRLVGDGRYYANLFKIHSFPTNVVINRSGNVVFYSTGYGMATPKWIANAIVADMTPLQQ